MANEKSTSPFRNRLLCALSPSDVTLLTPHLRPVALKLRQELEQPGRPIRRAYFIEQGIASVVSAGIGKDRVETGLIGREGMTGLMVLLGNHQSPNATFIQAADRKSTRLNSSHMSISYAVFCLKKKKKLEIQEEDRWSSTEM